MQKNRGPFDHPQTLNRQPRKLQRNQHGRLNGRHSCRGTICMQESLPTPKIQASSNRFRIRLLERRTNIVRYFGKVASSSEQFSLRPRAGRPTLATVFACHFGQPTPPIYQLPQKTRQLCQQKVQLKQSVRQFLKYLRFEAPTRKTRTGIR